MEIQEPLKDKVNESLLKRAMENKDIEKGIVASVYKDIDNGKHRDKRMTCRSCMWFSRKDPTIKDDSPITEETVFIGRCRRHAPTMSGWPVMFMSDWCGDHKLDENKI